MKKFILIFIIMTFIFSTCAGGENLSPTLRYYTDNENVTITLPNEPITDYTELYNVLAAPEIFDEDILEHISVDECFFITCSTEVGLVKFFFPTYFNKENTVLNVFVYNEEDGSRNTLTVLGSVTDDGFEVVDLTGLPVNTSILMYVLHIVKN